MAGAETGSLSCCACTLHVAFCLFRFLRGAKLISHAAVMMAGKDLRERHRASRIKPCL